MVESTEHVVEPMMRLSDRTCSATKNGEKFPPQQEHGTASPAPKLDGLRRKASRITKVLHKHYGSPRHNNKDDPLDELIFIMLSLMTTSQSCNRVFDKLKRSFSNWDELLQGSLSDLIRIIRRAGLSRQKAPRIRAILSKLKHDFGSATLEPLRSMGSNDVEGYLTSLPGVGTKTAKCVMMYSLGRKVLPVDTHVWRVARRVGLVKEAVRYERVHEELERVVQPKDRHSFHVNAVAHGRSLCTAARPRCGECPILELCEYGKSGYKF